MTALVTESPLSVETRTAVRAQAREAAGLVGRGRTPKAVIATLLATEPRTTRALALEAGFEVPARGRLPLGVVEAVTDLV